MATALSWFTGRSATMADMHLTPRRLAIAAVVCGILAVAGFVGVYAAFFNPRAVATVRLPAPTAPSGKAPAILSATWTVSPGSFVGYRVREQLARLPAPSDAVGRSSAISGSATVMTTDAGSVSVSAISITADLTQLTSDSGRRDGYVQGNSLETAAYPNATFVSSEPFSIPDGVLAGSAGSATVRGTFTIHGQSKAVSIPLQIQRDGAAVNIAASFKFNWGDFGVREPRVAIASVQGNPTIEISLILTST